MEPVSPEQNCSRILGLHFGGFLGLLAPELAPSGGPGAPKTFQKADAKIDPNFDGFWDRFQKESGGF